MLSCKASSFPMPQWCQKWDWTWGEQLLRQINQTMTKNREKRKQSWQKAADGGMSPKDLCTESYTCPNLPGIASLNGVCPQKRLAGNWKPVVKKTSKKHESGQWSIESNFWKLGGAERAQDVCATIAIAHWNSTMPNWIQLLGSTCGWQRQRWCS